MCGRAKDHQTLATKARLGADGSPCALASLATAMRLSVQIAPTAAVKQQSTSKVARLIVRGVPSQPGAAASFLALDDIQV